MSTYTHTPSPFHFHFNIGSFFETIADILASFSRARAAEQMFTTLHAMSEEELARRNLSRDDITAIVVRVLDGGRAAS